jgi:hypothetical protein
MLTFPMFFWKIFLNYFGNFYRDSEESRMVYVYRRHQKLTVVPCVNAEEHYKY